MITNLNDDVLGLIYTGEDDFATGFFKIRSNEIVLTKRESLVAQLLADYPGMFVPLNSEFVSEVLKLDDVYLDHPLYAPTEKEMEVVETATNEDVEVPETETETETNEDDAEDTETEVVDKPKRGRKPAHN